MHEDYYVRRVEALSAGLEVPDRQDYGLDTPDTPAFPGMDEAARWHVGGTLHGARLISEGSARRVLQLGGGLHHAGRNFASGFCVYNDLAIAIRHLVRHGLWVLYVDVDVHHGDGVQHILDDDRRVLTISLHESGKFLFPGTGEVHELGPGLGRGLKLNVPLVPFTEGPSYLEVFEQVIRPALGYFRPGVLVVQAGADAHFDDRSRRPPAHDARLRSDLSAAARLGGRVHRGPRAFHARGRLFDARGSTRVGPSVSADSRPSGARRDLPAAWRERWRPVLGGEPAGAVFTTVRASAWKSRIATKSRPKPSGGRPAPRSGQPVLALRPAEEPSLFRIIPEGRDFREYALLRDGESLLLRTATPDDVPAVDALMKLASRESLRMRFMGSVAYVSRSVIEFTCSGEPSRAAVPARDRRPGAGVPRRRNRELHRDRASAGRPRSRFSFSTNFRGGASAL